MTKSLDSLVRQTLEQTDGKLDPAVERATKLLLDGLQSRHATHVETLVREALRARMRNVHGEERREIKADISAASPRGPVLRAKPVPMPVRRSNAEIQAFIDRTLEYRILGDVKLGDATRNDLLRAAAMNRKQGQAMLANANWQETLGRQLQGGKTVRESGFDGVAVRRLIRDSGGTLEQLEAA